MSVYGTKGEGLRDAKGEPLREESPRFGELSTGDEGKGERLQERNLGKGGGKGDRLQDAKGDSLRDRVVVDIRAGSRPLGRLRAVGWKYLAGGGGQGERLRDAKGESLRDRRSGVGGRARKVRTNDCFRSPQHVFWKGPWGPSRPVCLPSRSQPARATCSWGSHPTAEVGPQP